ncbi:hypothetical protein F5Y00DRAFT_268845 [Daldinia vernicosa]|uniref:uncharacterized protein n=1 Tax=Daldinia vernicosa TaxID=114800 RepID=UPI00200785D4|nr:uncharacterized protein F5Y00DRAFT_268845 [Daldinia vernicosa]KAI0849752.1 hypothetical protein F5Y00DRAFT_268845 [Daldinia vernicosa]
MLRTTGARLHKHQREQPRNEIFKLLNLFCDPLVQRAITNGDEIKVSVQPPRKKQRKEKSEDTEDADAKLAEPDWYNILTSIVSRPVRDKTSINPIPTDKDDVSICNFTTTLDYLVSNDPIPEDRVTGTDFLEWFWTSPLRGTLIPTTRPTLESRPAKPIGLRLGRSTGSDR